MAVVDWTDPCARYAALHAAYYQTLTGGAETLIRYRTDGGEREVRYAQSNIAVLRSEMDRAQAECAAKNGIAPTRRRFAIRAGARREIP
jgi:hypothetical protein